MVAQSKPSANSPVKKGILHMSELNMYVDITFVNADTELFLHFGE